MQKPSNKYNRLYVVIIGLLFLPLLEGITNLIPVKPLLGAIANKNKTPNFSLASWFEGTYQTEKELVVNDSIGFRNILVRVNNQLDYALFNISHAQNIVVGKDGFLYETHYIDGYYGTDFDGTFNIEKRLRKLEYINDTLAKLNKTLILLIAPNKAIYYPEYLPDNPNAKKDSSNYETWLKLLKNSPIHYIDFNSYFVANKYKSKYPLEPKHGMHWSMYGCALAGDSLVKYIEAARHIKMPKPVWKAITLERDRDIDVDAENSMDLVFNLPGPLMAYPDVKFEHDSTKTRPGVLCIGDSYYWGFVAGYDIGNGFSPDSKFWYYFKKPDHQTPTRQEVKDELNNKDIVLMVATAHNLVTLGWDFIDSAYYMYKGTNPIHNYGPEYRKKIAELKSKIQAAPDWLHQIETGAKERGISVDSALTLNAIWIIEHTATN